MPRIGQHNWTIWMRRGILGMLDRVLSEIQKQVTIMQARVAVMYQSLDDQG